VFSLWSNRAMGDRAAQFKRCRCLPVIRRTHPSLPPPAGKSRTLVRPRTRAPINAPHRANAHPLSPGPRDTQLTLLILHTLVIPSPSHPP
jgi:hypothetical protein